MKSYPARRASTVLVAAFATFCAWSGPSRGSIKDPALASKAQKAIDRGVAWLRSQQQPDGSWGHHPGLTALAMTAVARNHVSDVDKNRKTIANGMKFLETMIKPDGSIFDRDLPVYNTSVALMAICASGDSKYGQAILNARRFLVDQQVDEGEGSKPSDKDYGGIGYGDDDPHPDLSNLQFALEGLRASSLDKNDQAWKRALVFLQRCQNRSESNDQAWAGNDGGFVYSPGESKAGGTKSYGSMTYAAVKSFIYAHMDKSDPRVQAAIDWIRKHYTLDENPGMGAQGLYYYYNTFAKALRAYGEVEVVDDKGKKHKWADDLSRVLIGRQNKDGSWHNKVSNRWWEGNKLLVTSESVFALSEALADLGPPKDECPALSASGLRTAESKDR